MTEKRLSDKPQSLAPIIEVLAQVFASLAAALSEEDQSERNRYVEEAKRRLENLKDNSWEND